MQTVPLWLPKYFTFKSFKISPGQHLLNATLLLHLLFWIWISYNRFVLNVILSQLRSRTNMVCSSTRDVHGSFRACCFCRCANGKKTSLEQENMVVWKKGCPHATCRTHLGTTRLAVSFVVYLCTMINISFPKSSTEFIHPSVCGYSTEVTYLCGGTKHVSSYARRRLYVWHRPCNNWCQKHRCQPIPFLPRGQAYQ